MLWNGEGLMSSRYAATKRSLAGGPVEERNPCIAVMESEGISTLSVHETGSASTTTVVISLPPSDLMLFLHAYAERRQDRMSEVIFCECTMVFFLRRILR